MLAGGRLVGGVMGPTAKSEEERGTAPQSGGRVTGRKTIDPKWFWVQGVPILDLQGWEKDYCVELVFDA